MRVYYVEGRGFGGASGFVEVPEGASVDDENLEVFQKQNYLSVIFECSDVRIGLRSDVFIGRVDEAEAPKTSERPKRSITATGTIQNARFGAFSLSLLGSENEHSSVDVSIREEEEESCFAAGMAAKDDLDIEIKEGFFVEATITSEAMNDLVAGIKEPGSRLVLRVDYQRFKGFYAAWSPSISEGRVIKFLDNIRDVENRSEVPNDFVHVPAGRRQEGVHPISIFVGYKADWTAND